MYDRLTASQNIRSAWPTANSLPTDNQVDFEEREIQLYPGIKVLKKKHNVRFEKIKKKVVESMQKNDGKKQKKKKILKAKSSKK